MTDDHDGMILWVGRMSLVALGWILCRKVHVKWPNAFRSPFFSLKILAADEVQEKEKKRKREERKKNKRRSEEANRQQPSFRVDPRGPSRAAVK